MLQKFIRKMGQAPVPLDVMKRASAAFNDGTPLQEVSWNFNIDRATLRRFIVKCRGKTVEDILTGYSRLLKSRCVFPLQMENYLAQHIKDLADRFHYLSVAKCTALAYEFAKQNGTPVPENWDKEQSWERLVLLIQG